MRRNMSIQVANGFVLKQCFTLLLVILLNLSLAAPVAWTQVGSSPVHALLNEAKEQVNRRPAEAEKLASNILETYADTGNLDILLHARAIRAQALNRLGEPTEALALAEEGLELAQSKEIGLQIIAELYYATGMAQQALGNLTKSFFAYQQAYNSWVELRDEPNKNSMLISMAGLYIESGDIARAISNYEHVLPWVQEHGDTYTQSRVFNNLAYALVNQKENERALELLAKARRLAIEAESPLVTAYAYENTGQAFLQNGQLDEAETYLNYALNLAAELGLDEISASGNLNLAWVEFQRQNIEKAKAYAIKAKGFASDSANKANLRDAHFLLARLERAQGNYAEAIDLYEMYIAYQDEVASDEASRRLSILEAEFQLSQKESEIELLQRTREIGDLRLRQTRTFKNAAVLGAALLLGIIAILVYLLRSMSLANRRAAQKTKELLVTQRELEKASKVKSDILAITSHEIRTPLNAIMGMSQILQRTNLDKDQQRFAQTIHSSGEILIATLNDILDLSKIEAGRLDIRDDIFNVKEIAERLNQLWRVKAEEKGLRFTIDIADVTEQNLHGDPHRIQQVIFNLVSNAIKFTSDGIVEIRFCSETTAHNLVKLKIVVRDEGIGIPEDKIERIFEPFHQVDSGTARSFGGTGLGLAICRQLTNLMGGTIAVDSTVGFGSTFTVELPCAIAKDVQDPSARTESDLEALNHLDYRPKILVVEDNQLNQMVIKQLLKDVSADLSFASDGQEALFTLEESDFDLILMDLHMPVMDGLAATRSIRARPDHIADIPIIALTADAMAGDRQKVLDAGMNDYVSKPIDLPVLLAAIKRNLKEQPTEKLRAAV